LAGRLLEKGGWPHLKIPAIAEQDEHIPIGPGRIYRRKAGATSSRPSGSRNTRSLQLIAITIF
jgi:hypothetical protein